MAKIRHSGQFKKGPDSRRSGGRPKGTKNKFSIAALAAAIRQVEKKKGKKLLVKFAEQAYSNPMIMTAIMKKLLPDLKAVEGLILTLDASMSDDAAADIRDKLRKRF